jgi:hypothetical protein
VRALLVTKNEVSLRRKGQPVKIKPSANFGKFMTTELVTALPKLCPTTKADGLKNRPFSLV